MTADRKQVITPDKDSKSKSKEVVAESINPFDLAGSCVSRPSLTQTP